jgi:hypothetical protein
MTKLQWCITIVSIVLAYVLGYAYLRITKYMIHRQTYAGDEKYPGNVAYYHEVVPWEWYQSSSSIMRYSFYAYYPLMKIEACCWAARKHHYSYAFQSSAGDA